MFIQNIEYLCSLTSGVEDMKCCWGCMQQQHSNCCVAVVTDGNNYKKMTAECEEIFLIIPCP